MQPLSPSQREAAEEAIALYEQGVTPEVAALFKARGIEEATAVSHRLGVVGTDPFPGHEQYRGWISIPYLNHKDMGLTLRFRCARQHDCRDNGHGKYMTLAGDPARVYNVGAIHRAKDEIHVTEGEFDAMILNQVGLPAVAIPGASGWQPHHRRMLAGFSRIFVWGDPDEAGAKFTTAVCRSLRNAKGVRLKGGDVTDNYMRDGAEGIHALVQRGTA